MNKEGLLEREKIAARILGTVVVIDDKVFDESEKLTELGKKLLEGCETKGIACHLHQYPATSLPLSDETAREYNNKALRVARRGDVVILDWNLGEGNEHAIEILKALAEDLEMRFILIYTSDLKVDVIGDTLKEHLSGLITESVEFNREDYHDEIDADGFVKGKSGKEKSIVYNLNNKLLISIHDKNKRDSRPEVFIPSLPIILSHFYPNCIHWAALDFLGKVKHIVPKVLPELEGGTEGAIRTQMLYQRENEVADLIAEAILEEVRYHLEVSPLSVITNTALANTFAPGIIAAAKENADSWMQIVTRAYPGIFERGDEASIANKMDLAREKWSSLNVNDFLEILVDTTEYKNVQKLLELFPIVEGFDEVLSRGAFAINQNFDELRSSHLSLATFRESVFWIDINRAIIRQGYIYTDPQKNFWLCVAPSCDCYRPKGKKLWFLKGSSIDDGELKRSGTNEIQCNARIEVSAIKKNVSIKWQLNEVLALGTGQVRNMNLVGALRPLIVSRIIQKVWTSQSRVGIDTSEYVRKLRSELP